MLSGTPPHVWGFRTCIADHMSVLMYYPVLFDAYIGPHAVEPRVNEGIMCTVNSLKQCTYCTGLHGELARIAGVKPPTIKKLLGAKSVADVRSASSDVELTYARVFVETAGRGERADAAYSELEEAVGSGKARSVRALCFFLWWGSMSGNTISHCLSWLTLQGRPSNPLFELLFTAYYGPLFIVIALLNALLPFMPKLPKVLSGIIGVVLTVCAGAFIVPFAALSLVPAMLFGTPSGEVKARSD